MKTRLSFLSLCLFGCVAMVQAEETDSAEYAEGGEAAAAKVDLDVIGIQDNAVLDNVNIYLTGLADDEADGSERYKHLVTETVDKALRAQGYYNSSYQFGTSKQGKLTLTVGLNGVIKIDETDIDITGQAKDDSEFAKLLQTVPAKGTPLNHAAYDEFKSSLETLGQKRGYFDGEMPVHRLEVTPSQGTADWRIAYESGGRYRYGAIAFHNSQIREDYLRNILRIKSGDYYLNNDLSKLSSDFSSSKWFSSVVVEPKLNEEAKTVDLNVLLQPRKRNAVEVGIGFDTDVGPTFQLGWDKPWINSRGHSLETDLNISQVEQIVEFGYNIPVKANPLNHYYQISGSLEHEDDNDTKSTAATLGFQRFWNYETGWSFSLGMKARYDSFQQGSEPKTKTLLLYPTASLNRTRSDGNRFPLWGDSQKITVNWGSKMWASDVDFVSVKASSAWVRAFTQNHRLFVRGEVGYLTASEFERMPPAMRFFAGGDNSVRGFGYKEISPTDSNGKLTGGSHLATSTLEYQYQVAPGWWGAVFYDSGLSALSFKNVNIYQGAGVGVRWVSPIGAIKLDIATPVKKYDKESGVQFYIGLGSEL